MRILGVVASLAVALGCSGAPKPPLGGTQQPTGAAVGAVAPDAQLTDASGARVALATALHRRAETVVVFYRGFW
jgi:hypothetical protein